MLSKLTRLSYACQKYGELHSPLLLLPCAALLSTALLVFLGATRKQTGPHFDFQRLVVPPTVFCACTNRNMLGVFVGSTDTFPQVLQLLAGTFFGAFLFASFFPCVLSTSLTHLPSADVSVPWSTWTTPRQVTTVPPPTEESCPLAEFTPHTGYEPKLLDDFHYSETTELIFRDESSDKDVVPSYLFDAELDDETI